MTGKRYYLTTLGAWHRHAARFANSHWIALNSSDSSNGPVDAQHVEDPQRRTAPGEDAGQNVAQTAQSSTLLSDEVASDDAMPILALIEADEGAHLALEDDAAFEALPHPLAQKPISETAQAALGGSGVAPGATTFDAAEAVARVHPLLRHRVF
jgi:hypothetical protein